MPLPHHPRLRARVCTDLLGDRLAANEGVSLILPLRAIRDDFPCGVNRPNGAPVRWFAPPPIPDTLLSRTHRRNDFRSWAKIVSLRRNQSARPGSRFVKDEILQTQTSSPRKRWVHARAGGHPGIKPRLRRHESLFRATARNTLDPRLRGGDVEKLTAS